MAIQKRRTYSTRDRKQAEYNRNGNADKRIKLSHEDDEDGEARPRRLTQIQPKKSLNLVKGGLKQYSGPISIPSDDDDDVVSQIPQGGKQLESLFDKALNCRPSLKQNKQPAIYGSGEGFDEKMNDHRQDDRSGSRPNSNYLATPPSDTPQHMGRTSTSPFSKNAERLSQVLTPPTEAKEMSPTLTTTSESGQLRKSQNEKEEEVPQLSICPRRDITGNRLSSRSAIAKLWSSNQETSGLLRLPKQVRDKIYDYVFCGQDTRTQNTINIRYITWKMTKVRAKRISKPVFKYGCTVFDNPVNPFMPREEQRHNIKISTSYTLLHGVCRQLYEETADYPYKHNLIAFDSHLIMMNFLVNENRLSRAQRQAITKLKLPDNLPGANLLSYLPNLTKVYLAFPSETIGDTYPWGWYNVERKEGKDPQLVHQRTGQIF